MKAFQNGDEVGAAAVDYLRVCGHLVFAYLWARMAKVALDNNPANLDLASRADPPLALARRALFRLLAERHGVKANPRVFVYGEDVGGKYGNAFLLLRPLLKDFGDRIINSPIAEGAVLPWNSGGRRLSMYAAGELGVVEGAGEKEPQRRHRARPGLPSRARILRSEGG